MSEPKRPTETSPEAKPWSAQSSPRTQVETEDLPDSSAGSASGTSAAGIPFAQRRGPRQTPILRLLGWKRMQVAVLDSFERARGALSMREDNFFLLLSVIIGLFAGLAVVCFRISIDYTRLWLLGSGINPGPVRIVLVPTAAGLLLAFVVLRIFPRVKGSGVTQTKSAVYIYDGYIPFDTVIGKFLTCALAIGSGQSLGPEDPSLQMGAGIASALGRRLHLSREKVRLIAPVGAAAGLAAAFNAPIAAVLFVIEEVIGTWSAGILGAVVLAAVAAVVVMRLFLGAEPLFQIPPYSMAHASELLSYAALGVLGGITSLIFVKLLRWVRSRARRLPRWTLYVQPALAGMIIGGIGLRFPQIMGAGYEYIDQAMHGQFFWRTLVALALLKVLATSLSISSGAPGGMFAPALFVGSMVGAAVGTVQHQFFPGAAGPLGAYALVGMGTLFAGFLRAPMTSVFMVLEVSGNYSIILPVIISNAIAYVIARRFQETPIFDLITREEGLDLPSMEEGREQTTLLVENAMRKPMGLILKASDTVGDAASRLADMTEDPLLVSYDTGRWTLVYKSTLLEAAKAGKAGQPLSSILPNTRLSRLHPDQSLDLALRLIRDAPFLPVVHRADARHLVGLLSLDDILAAYRRASIIKSTAAE
jgi:CIC family chloride channel protein